MRRVPGFSFLFRHFGGGLIDRRTVFHGCLSLLLLTSSRSMGTTSVSNDVPVVFPGVLPSTITGIGPGGLQLTKSVLNSQSVVGDTVTFVLTISSVGPSPGLLTLIDPLPAGVDFIGIGPGTPPPFLDGRVLRWVLPPLPPPVFTQLFTIHTRAVLPGPWTNQAVLKSVDGPGLAQGAALFFIDDIPVTNPPSALHLTKIASTPEATVGDPVQFWISVSNAGPSISTNIGISDLLPAGFTFVSADEAGHPDGYDPVSGRWSLDLLPPGTVRTLALSTVAAVAGSWTNVASLVQPAGESSSAFVNVLAPASADLAVVKFADPVQVGLEQPVTYVIRVGNQGPDDAKDILVRDTLPPGVTLTDQTVPEGTTFDSKKMEWTIPKLGANRFFELSLVTTSKLARRVTNVVEITQSGVRDPFPENNRASAPSEWIPYSACGVAALCRDSNRPHTNALIELQQAGKKIAEVRSDSQGAFCFTNLGAGKYVLIAHPADPKSGIMDSEPFETEYGAGQSGSFITLYSDWPVVQGTVRFGAGGPGVPDAEVKLKGKDSNGGAVALTTSTDKSGVYRFTNLKPGDYVITPTPIKAVRFVPVSAKAAFTGCQQTLDFIHSGELSISGRVATCDATPAPIPYATVRLSLPNYPNLAVIHAAQDGTYKFTGLMPGNYTLTAESPTYDFKSVAVALSDRSQVVRITGSPKAGTIGVRVVDAKGAPQAGVTVVYFAPGAAAPKDTLVTDSNGSVVFTKVPNGVWGVRPLSPDGKLGFQPEADVVPVGVPNACRNQSIFTTTSRAVEVEAIEVVQVIQDWRNSVPLVEGKETLVRVFLKPAGSNTAPVTVKGGRLRIEPEGGKVTTLKGKDVIARADFSKVRNDNTASLAFDISKFAKGNVTLTVEWPNGNLTTSPEAKAEGGVTANTVSVHFEAAPLLPVKWALLSWKFKNQKGEARTAQIPAHRTRLLATLPIINLPNRAEDQKVVKWEPDYDPSVDDPDILLKNTSSLHDLVEFTRNRDEPKGGKSIWYTLVTGIPLRDSSMIPGDYVLVGKPIEEKFYRNLPAHEMGHALGRHHDVHSALGITFGESGPSKHGACNEIASSSAPDFPMDTWNGQPLQPTLGPMGLGDFRYAFGWDHTEGTYVSPFLTPDIMSYCNFSTQWRWPGLYTYTNIYAALVQRFGRVNAPKLQGPPPTTPCIILRGRLEAATDRVSLAALWTSLHPKDAVFPEAGDYTLRVLGEDGTEMLAAPFAPDFIVDADPQPVVRPVGSFLFCLPPMESVGAIEILHTNQLIYRQIASANAPGIQLLEPVSGTVATGDELLLRWTASDPDGEALTYLVDISSDNGATWRTLAHDVTTNSMTVPISNLPGSDHTVFRVWANDGMHTSNDKVTVVIPGHPPTLKIVQPMEEQSYTDDDTVSFTAVAVDLEDGQIDGTGISWTSDVQGLLGSGSPLVLDASTLAEGPHRITAAVSDLAGNQAVQQVSIVVQRRSGPGLAIQLFDDVAELSWSSAYDLWQVEATLSLHQPYWYRVSGDPQWQEGRMSLDTPLSDETVYYRLVAP